MYSDQVVFVVLKSAIDNVIKSKFEFLTKILFYQILKDEPNVVVYTNQNKEYEWKYEDVYVKQFYDFLIKFNQEDFVFQRLGDSLDDFEFLGDCYCNFQKNMVYNDIVIERKFEFPKKKLDHIQNALAHFFEFIEPFNYDEKLNKFDDNSLNHIFEGSYKEYYTKTKNALTNDKYIEIHFDNKTYTIIK